MWTQQFVCMIAHCVDLKGAMHWDTDLICTVGTVRSPFRILLVPECCVIKLACTVADKSVSILCHGWIVF